MPDRAFSVYSAVMDPATALAVPGRAGEPWEMQPGESAEQYEWFCHYRDLPPGARSLRKLIEHFRSVRAETETEVGTLALASLRKTAQKYQWPERAAAWDAALRHERDLAVMSQARDAVDRQVQIAEQMTSVAARFYEELEQRLAAGALKRANFETLLKLMPNATRAFAEATRITRLAGGLSTEHLEVHGRVVQGAAGSLDLGHLSVPELQELRALVSELRSRQLQAGAAPVPSGEIVEGESRELPSESSDRAVDG